MKTLLCCLMLASIPAFSQTPEALTPTDNPDVFIQKHSDKIQFEITIGKSAIAHLQNLRLQHPKAFTTKKQPIGPNGELPYDQNWVPTEDVVVIRPMRRDNSLVSYTASTVKGEIISWSYNDFDNKTWEGQMMIKKYATGEAFSFKGQIDTYTVPEQPDFTQTNGATNYTRLWYNAGGDGGKDGPLPISFESSFDPSIEQILLRDSNEKRRCWLRGTVAGCGSGAIRCIGAGPAWPKCAAIACVAALIGSGVACFFF